MGQLWKSCNKPYPALTADTLCESSLGKTPGQVSKLPTYGDRWGPPNLSNRYHNRLRNVSGYDYTFYNPRERYVMPNYTIEAVYRNRHVLTIEAPDRDRAVQIFYQKGGGDAIDGDGWDDIEVDEADEDEPIDYTDDDYDPNGGHIRW